jgi:hypothetical protein
MGHALECQFKRIRKKIQGFGLVYNLLGKEGRNHLIQDGMW